MRTHRKNKKRKPWILIIVLLIIVAGIGGFGWINMAGGPVDKDDDKKISVVIEEGSTTQSIGDALEAKDLISSTFIFKIKSKLTGNDGKYQPGIYSLSKSQSMEDMMKVMVSGKSNVTRFTIPEGYTTKQTMNTLVDAGLVTEEEFMDEVVNGKFDYKFLEDAPDDETRLEGFLYPDTYEVFKNATAHNIIDRMLSQFDDLVKDEYYDKAKSMNMDIREIVTLASMIERETKVSDERAKVASVIYNRIKKGMRLQIDATIQYILKEPKEHLLYSDLKVESPYNTYLNDGLPPGPICSPRIECIEAALNPDDTKYIYYVMTPELDGKHNFSETAAEFEKNKAAYKEAVNNQ